MRAMRRNWPVLIMCAGALVVSIGGCRADPAQSGGPSPLTPRQSTPGAASAPAHVATTQENVVATRKFAGWLLHAVPMPAKAREWKHSPNGHFRRQSLWLGNSDPALARTTWWTVPLSAPDFASWLRQHAPEGLTAEDGGGSLKTAGVWERDLDFYSPSTAAHALGQVNFAYMTFEDGVVVRVDTFAAARFARTTMVPDDVTAVKIEHTSTSYRPRSKPHTTTRTITDRRAIDSLVRMVNALPGTTTVPFYSHCRARPVENYGMTFVAPKGTYVAELDASGCRSTVALTRDGQEAGPALDPGSAFTRAADHYLA